MIDLNLILSKLFRRASILQFLNFSLILYTIFSDNGYLAVRDEKSEQVYTTQVRIELLPPQDAAMIEAGIACENRRELAEVMENYIS